MQQIKKIYQTVFEKIGKQYQKSQICPFRTFHTLKNDLQSDSIKSIFWKMLQFKCEVVLSEAFFGDLNML